MKIRFYVDLWPGIDPQRYLITASTTPQTKPVGTKRIAFDVDIPDSLMFGVDGVAAGTSKPEETE